MFQKELPTTIAVLFVLMIIGISACRDKNVVSTDNDSNPTETATTPNAEVMIQNVYHRLQSWDTDAEFKDVTYSFSKTNSLPTNWLIRSTPQDKSCQLLNTIKSLFSHYVQHKPNEPHYIDILQLGDDRPNDGFQLQMIESICEIAQAAKAKVVIRYLEGNKYDSKTPVDNYFIFFDELKKKYGTGGASNVTIYAASLDYPWSDVSFKDNVGSWNHAKIIAIDGQTSIVGGQNYWSDYLPGNVLPYDVSINVDGPVTASAHEFANFLWKYVADPSTGSTMHKAWQLGTSTAGDALPREFSSSNFPSPTTGKIPILAVGNLGLWYNESKRIALELWDADTVKPLHTGTTIMNADNVLIEYPFSTTWDDAASKVYQSSISARHLLLQQVQQNGHVRIAQQKIADTDITAASGYVVWPSEFLTEIIYVLAVKNAHVDILVSSHDGGSGYNDDMGAMALKGVIVSQLAKKLGNPSKAISLANDLLQVKQVPTGTYNHSKIWIVDNSVFYVGSDNIYPGYLQEYGYVIGDSAVTDLFIQNYWDKVWSIAVDPTD